MKGDEGWFKVIVLVIVCMSGTYAYSMKGDELFTFRFSNFHMYMPVYAYQRAQTGVRMYIIMSTCINDLSICNQMLKS